MKRIISMFIVFVALVATARIEDITKKSENNVVDSTMNNSTSLIDSSMSNSVTLESSSDSSFQEVILSKKVKIYINPSVQVNNVYINNLGTEAEHMNDIANLMYQELMTYAFIDTLCNCSVNGLSLSKSVKESNDKGSDIHLALHSNAGGGKGVEVFGKGDNSKFAQVMYDGFNELDSFVKRGVKNGNNLYEVKSSTATYVALMELLFHDNLEEALYIVNNKMAIAHQLVTTIVDFVIENYAK